MDLIELAKNYPDLQLHARMGDLLEATKILIEKMREEVRAESHARERETGFRLIPKAEVERMLDVAPSTLWRWEQYGYLNTFRIGRKVYYRESEVQATIEAHKSTRTNH